MNRKDELFNDLVKLLTTTRVNFYSSTVTFDGSYYLQWLTNALWYIANNHLTITEASKQAKEVIPVPNMSKGSAGYNEIKIKKVKAMSLFSDLLHLHAQALSSLLLKPYTKSTGSWKQCQIG